MSIPALKGPCVSSQTGLHRPDRGAAYSCKLPTNKGTREDAADLVRDKVAEEEPDNDEFVLCRQCLQVLTTYAERIHMQGAHRHTFVNPQGVVFEIGCYRTVRGCRYAGPPTKEWSWFLGYSWRIAICSICLVHLGWLYLSDADSDFHGLILDRIIEPG